MDGDKMSDDTISEVDTMFMKKSFDEIDMKTILIEKKWIIDKIML